MLTQSSNTEPGLFAEQVASQYFRGRGRKDASSSQEGALTQTQAKPLDWGPSLASLGLEAGEPGCPSRRLMLTLSAAPLTVAPTPLVSRDPVPYESPGVSGLE